MSDWVRSVLIAAASEEECRRLGALAEQSRMPVCGCVRDAKQIPASVDALCPDLLLTDLVLAGSDAFDMAGRLWRQPLRVYPGILVQYYGILPRRDAEAFREMGGITVEKPLDAEKLEAAANALKPGKRHIPQSRVERLEEILDMLDVKSQPGRRYLTESILLAHMDRRLTDRLMSGLYAGVGTKYGANMRHVEQAMRHAVDDAWRGSAADAQYALFRGTIDAQRGKPTCGEMIAQLADILRLEG